MTRPHLPDLDALDKLPNKQIKFYAIVGAVVSLTAALEFALVDIFQKGLRIERQLAEALVFPVIGTKDRRNLATNAMLHRLESEPDDRKDRWAELSSRIMRATSWSSERHLISHNPIQSREGGGGPMFGALGEGAIGEGPSEKFSVELSLERAIALEKKPKAADFNSLLAQARELVELLNDLQTFLHFFGETRDQS